MEKLSKSKQDEKTNPSAEDQQSITADEETIQEGAPQAGHHVGGVRTPDGYAHIGSISQLEDGSLRFNVENLLGIVEIDEIDGVSLKLDQPNGDRTTGTIHGRIIHDFAASVHIFRKDYPEQNRTHFHTKLGHGGPTL